MNQPIFHGGRVVPGFALGDEPLRAALRDVIDAVKNFSRGLSEREEAILRMGLEASHMEESVVQGDWTRARAHAEKISELFDPAPDRRPGSPGKPMNPSEPFIRCGYCGSDQHTGAECPVASEIQEVDDDDETISDDEED